MIADAGVTATTAQLTQFLEGALSCQVRIASSNCPSGSMNASSFDLRVSQISPQAGWLHWYVHSLCLRDMLANDASVTCRPSLNSREMARMLSPFFQR